MREQRAAKYSEVVSSSEVSKQSKGATRMLVLETESIFSEEQHSWASSMFVLEPEPADIDADGDGVISAAEAKAAAKAACGVAGCREVKAAALRSSLESEPVAEARP